LSDVILPTTTFDELLSKAVSAAPMVIIIIIILIITVRIKPNGRVH